MAGKGISTGNHGRETRRRGRMTEYLTGGTSTREQSGLEFGEVFLRT
jgi:hypothetical protein